MKVSFIFESSNLLSNLLLIYFFGWCLLIEKLSVTKLINPQISSIFLNDFFITCSMHVSLFAQSSALIYSLQIILFLKKKKVWLFFLITFEGLLVSDPSNCPYLKMPQHSSIYNFKFSSLKTHILLKIILAIKMKKIQQGIQKNSFKNLLFLLKIFFSYTISVCQNGNKNYI